MVGRDCRINELRLVNITNEYCACEEIWPAARHSQDRTGVGDGQHADAVQLAARRAKLHVVCIVTTAASTHSAEGCSHVAE